MAPASTIMMASLVPATVRCRSIFSRSATVGLSTSSPSTRPTTTEPVGPAQGISDTHRAMEEPSIAGISGEQSLSSDRTVATTLHVVAHALGEERAQRAVDQTGGQDGLLGRTALALDEAAGDLAHGIELFLKVHAQGEEVDARAGRLGDGGADQHDRVAVADQDGTGRLLGVAPKLKGQLAPRKLCFVDLVFHCLGDSFRSRPQKHSRLARGVCPALPPAAFAPPGSARQTPRHTQRRLHSFDGRRFALGS